MSETIVAELWWIHKSRLHLNFQLMLLYLFSDSTTSALPSTVSEPANQEAQNGRRGFIAVTVLGELGCIDRFLNFKNKVLIF